MHIYLRNGQQYGFCIKLAASVENNPSVKRSDAKIDVTLTKTDKQCDFWPFLLAESGPASRPAWLKFDFDRWQDEEDDTEEEDSDLKKLAEEGALENQYAELMEKYKGRTMTPDEVEKRLNLLYGTYLLATISASSWLIFTCSVAYCTDILLKETFICKIFGCIAALGGLTKSDWQTILTGIWRVAVLWIIDGNPEIHTWLPVFALIVNYLMVNNSGNCIYYNSFSIYCLHTFKAHVSTANQKLG
uniref:CS domain-containing protein n=1 Tax=Ditylenchus dipsaci TaxID=166011 RepID=A0A915DYZ7_9BILA